MYNYNALAVTVCGSHREKNEDNCFLNGWYKRNVVQKDAMYKTAFTERSSFLGIVFDGIGGLRAGENASLAGCQAAETFFKSKSDDINELISEANKDICSLNSENHYNSGSTFVCLEKSNSMFRSWNIGDSRAYWIHTGKIEKLSEDHTEAESMRPLLGNESVKGKGCLTQFLGIEETEFLLEPHVSDWIEPKKGDHFLLCSDGLSGYVSDDQILQRMLDCTNIENEVLSLLEKAVDNGSRDNITVIVIDVA